MVGRFTNVVIRHVKDPEAVSAILAVMEEVRDEQWDVGVRHRQEMTGGDPLLRELLAVADPIWHQPGTTGAYYGLDGYANR